MSSLRYQSCSKHIWVKIKICKFRFSPFIKPQICNQQMSNIGVLSPIFVSKIHNNPLNPDVYFFIIYVTVLYEPNRNPDARNGVLHTLLYVPVDFILNIFIFHHFFSYLVPIENQLRYLCINVTKRVRENYEGLNVLVRWSCRAMFQQCN